MTEHPNGDAESDPPRDVSDQNREEQSAPHPPGDGGQPGEQVDTEHPPHSERSSARQEGRPGGAGEGSQATGHPDNAG